MQQSMSKIIRRAPAAIRIISLVLSFRPCFFGASSDGAGGAWEGETGHVVEELHPHSSRFPTKALESNFRESLAGTGPENLLYETLK